MECRTPKLGLDKVRNSGSFEAVEYFCGYWIKDIAPGGCDDC
jgi:hypothetical protein